MSCLGNHRAAHDGRPSDRVFPPLRWPRAVRRRCRERQCGLLWGHCFHRREGLARALTWWNCCMCARTVNTWPADQCAFCTIPVRRSDLEDRGEPTTTMWTKRNSSSGRFDRDRGDGD